MRGIVSQLLIHGGAWVAGNLDTHDNLARYLSSKSKPIVISVGYLTIEHGWSRNVLLHWLDSGLHKREGKAITNFQITLPSPQSDLAQQALKDPYCFDFLTPRE